MSQADMEAKFRGNARLALPADKVERLVTAVGGLARATRLDDLVRALHTPRSRS
jgi:hypothetical protein